MKGNKAVVLIIFIAIIAISAIIGSITVFYQNNQTQNRNAMSSEGIVAKIEGQRILVIDGATVEELKGKTEEEMLVDVENAIWFSVSIDQLKTVKTYDKIRITYSQLEESFPAQANANNIEVLSQNAK
ncbi:MAG: YobA family protein [Paenisporosarcina sp.]